MPFAAINATCIRAHHVRTSASWSASYFNHCIGHSSGARAGPDWSMVGVVAHDCGDCMWWWLYMCESNIGGSDLLQLYSASGVFYHCLAHTYSTCMCGGLPTTCTGGVFLPSTSAYTVFWLALWWCMVVVVRAVVLYYVLLYYFWLVVYIASSTVYIMVLGVQSGVFCNLHCIGQTSLAFKYFNVCIRMMQYWSRLCHA